MNIKLRILKLLAIIISVFPTMIFGQNITVNGDPLSYPVGIRGAVELEFMTDIGEYYQVEISPDLIAWDNEGYSIKGTGGLVSTVVSTRQYVTATYRVTDGADPNNIAPWTALTGIDPIVVDGTYQIGLNTTTASTGQLIKFDGNNWIFGPTDPTTVNNMQPYTAVTFVIALEGVYPSRSGYDPFIADIQMFGGNFAPRGWAYCNGQLLPISSYSALFSLIGTFYGGDGRTTFAVPDLRGRVPIHWGQGPGLSNRNIGEKGGSETTTHTH